MLDELNKWLPASPVKRTLTIALSVIVAILTCVLLALIGARVIPPLIEKPQDTPTPTAIPLPTVTETPLPTATATARLSPTLTATGRPTSTFTPRPTATVTTAISFRADKLNLNPGECTMLRWETKNVTKVFLDGAEVPLTGTRSVCPGGRQTFALKVQSPAGEQVQQVTLEVAAPNCEVVGGLVPEGLHLRYGPGRVYEPPLRILPKGTQLEPLGFAPQGISEDPWLLVRVKPNGPNGWVNARPELVVCNIELEKLPRPQLPPTPTRPPTITPTRPPTVTLTPTPARRIVRLPGAHPNGMAVDPERRRLFVAGRDSAQLHVIDENTLQVIANIPVGKQPFGIVYAQGLVFVANFSSASVSVVDSAKLALVRTIPTEKAGTEPTFLTFLPRDAETSMVYVALHGRPVGSATPSPFGSVAGINIAELSIVRSLGVGAGTYGIAAMPNVQRVYASNRDSFDIISLSTARLTNVPNERRAMPDESPYLLAADPERKLLYLTHSGRGQPVDRPDRLSAFQIQGEGGALTLARTVQTGNQGGAGGYIAIYPPGDDYWSGSVWVTADKQVLVYTPALTRVLKTLGAAEGIGANPFGIAINAGLGRVYIGDGNADQVLVLEARTLR